MSLLQITTRQMMTRRACQHISHASRSVIITRPFTSSPGLTTSTISASSAASKFRWLGAGAAALVGATTLAAYHTSPVLAAPSSTSPAVTANPTGAFKATESSVKVGLVQMGVTADKEANLKEAKKRIEEAVKKGAKLVVLPEMFNCPYANSSFPIYAEDVPAVGATLSSIPSSASTTRFMSALAAEHGIYLVAGSIPERAALLAGESKHPKSGLDHHLYNTAVVFGPDGTIVAKHRKVHLFDIDVPGKMTFRESDTLSAGASATWFDTPYARIGVGICYDIRFPEYAQLLNEKAGVQMLIYPGAFNTTTGPLHWELLGRGRAVDNQLWVLTCSPARGTDPKAYQAWGHSSVISPWGRVQATTEHQPDVIVTEIDMKEVSEMRKNIPVLTQKRKDIYRLQS